MVNDSNIADEGPVPPRRFRSAPKLWQDIMKSIVNEAYSGEGITYDMIDQAAADVGHSITREALRVKMARYVKSGFVRPVVDPMLDKRVRGAFWITEHGKKFFNLTDAAGVSEKPKTAMLPTSPSKWGQKALNIHSADATAK